MMDEDKSLREYLLKEADIVQGTIRRMASNSFLIKGWVITLVVGSVALGLAGWNVTILVAAVIMFWYLDAYYLRQERMFRELYNWVITNRHKTSDFLLDMNTSRFKNKVEPTCKVFFSVTLSIFYGTLLVVAVALAIAKGCNQTGGV